MVEWKKIGEVCSDVIVPMRDRPKVFDGSIPWCRIEDIEGMYFNKSLSGLMVSESVIKSMNLKVYPTGTVICSCSATLGVCAINTQPLITNQTFIGLVCSERINNRFLYYYMSTRKKELLSLSTTGTIPYVSREKFEKMDVPVPSLSEQIHIVEQLDTFTSSIENLKQQIAQRRKQYEYYRENLLDLEGKEGVEMKTLGDIMQIVRGASPRPIKNFITTREDGVNWIKIGDVAPGAKYITCCNEKITKDGAEKSRFLHVGDFILSNSMSFGRPYILKIDGCIHDGWIAMSDFEKYVLPDFLYEYLNSDVVQKYWIMKANNGGAMTNLNSDIVKETPIRIPSFLEQQRIVSILDTFEASIQNLEAQLKEREKQYEYYRNKLLTFE